MDEIMGLEPSEKLSLSQIQDHKLKKKKCVQHFISEFMLPNVLPQPCSVSVLMFSDSQAKHLLYEKISEHMTIH